MSMRKHAKSVNHGGETKVIQQSKNDLSVDQTIIPKNRRIQERCGRHKNYQKKKRFDKLVRSEKSICALGRAFWNDVLDA